MSRAAGTEFRYIRRSNPEIPFLSTVHSRFGLPNHLSGSRMNRTVQVRVNGKKCAADIPSNRLLTDFLRYDLGLTGTKEGCSVGICGACTVLLDNKMVAACLILAVSTHGREITTIEGIADEGRLHPLQQSFIDHGGFQCGICTPGQIMAAKSLLDENPDPSEAEIREWMAGSLCRCTGYYKILESIVKAVELAKGAAG